MTQDWPVADLDPVRRLRVIAAATPGAGYAEEVIAAPFGAVWELASDLEHSLPELLTDVRSFTIIPGQPERFQALARGRLGQRARFDVVLRPGWCLMQSRFVIGGMAAVPEAGGTRCAFLGGLRLPGLKLADPLVRPVGGRLVRRALRRLEHQLLT
jgi:hypothetical protein